MTARTHHHKEWAVDVCEENHVHVEFTDIDGNGVTSYGTVFIADDAEKFGLAVVDAAHDAREGGRAK